MGNTDEMLVRPSSLEQFANASSAPPAIWDTVREIAISTRQRLGDDRLAWISNLTMVLSHDAFALVHATPQSCWRAPSESASETDLELVYGSLARPTDVFGHSHCLFIRMFAAGTKTLINAGSAGLSYDGDPRASYFVLDDEVPTVRRIAYDVDRELTALAVSELPGAAWTSNMLRQHSPNAVIDCHEQCDLALTIVLRDAVLFAN